jgi:hypothetical protein
LAQFGGVLLGDENAIARVVLPGTEHCSRMGEFPDRETIAGRCNPLT